MTSRSCFPVRSPVARWLCVVALIWGVSPLVQAAQPGSEAVGPVALSSEEGPMRLHIVRHASFVATWNGRSLYVDPVGPITDYEGLPAPDLILITHAHSDHFDPETLAALDTRGATVVMPSSVAAEIDSAVGRRQIVVANAEHATAATIPIEAVAAYNLPASPKAHHPRGRGNGYVLTLADKRVYISGDTEGVPAMRQLEDIDLAFVCMNLPYTMDTEQAADAVLDFAPAVVYPYHYRGQDIADFKQRVNAGDPDIEVRLRDWYPGSER